MKISNIVFIFILVFSLAACAKPPTEKMNEAQDAVTRAENDADAVIYAPNVLVQARSALSSMKSEADIKRYDSAKEFAEKAINLADKAIADGKTGASRARDEATSLVNSLAGSLAETENALNAARQSNNIRADFDALALDLEAARRGSNEARQSLQANNYQDAVSKGQNVRSLLAGINSGITEAALDSSRKQ